MIYDTSAAISWYVDLPWSTAARRIVSDDPEPYAPDLIVAEAANGLWKYVRVRGMTEALALAALDHLQAALILTDTKALGRRAFSLAVALDHPVYDCFFLALAEERRGPVVTADRRLAGLAGNAGIEALAIS